MKRHPPRPSNGSCVSSRRLAIRLALTVFLAAPMGAMVFGATSSDQDDIEKTRTALEKWVETRRVISHEQRDWALGREMLNERIELVKQEIASLRERMKETEASITKADLARADLVAENDALKATSDALHAIVLSLEQRTTELLNRLPDPIRERVKPLSQRLPENPDDTKLSLSERFQNVVGILNEINKFNREITVTSEVRALPDGTSAEVTTMYLGIGQGYYVGGDGSIAGYGTATGDGWAWKSANAAAPHIAQAIAILKNEQVASFVRLPIEINSSPRTP